MNKEITCDSIWQEYQDGLNYQKQLGLPDSLPQYVRFREGDQWAPVTPRTKNFPRPVFNIVDMFVRVKRANIVNQPITLDYKPIESDDEEASQVSELGAESYTAYSKNLWENIDQDELNSDYVDDKILLGTGVLHYFWNENKSGGSSTKWIGQLDGETIDPLNIFFGNPRNKKVQEQPYIIISTRMRLQDAINYAEAQGKSKTEIDLILPDNTDQHNYDNDKDIQGLEEVTVLTRYYRKNGEVFFVKSTRSVILVEETPLTPTTETGISNYRMSLYPIVVGRHKRRRKCVYGIGEAQDLITINKLYNQMKGMIALNAIQCGNPALLVKKGALKQTITNEGGQIITDYYQGGGDGVKYMQPPSFSNIFSQISSEIFEMARTVNNVTDVSTGETVGANMAASAIIALQNQARTPFNEMQKDFMNELKEVGDIWAEFFKCYYTTDREISVEEDGKYKTTTFNGGRYAENDFKVKVEVGVSSEKEALVMNVLESLKASGDIDKKTFVELAPDSAIPFKSKLKQSWEDEEKTKLIQALEQIKEMNVMLQQLQGQTEQDQQMINDLTQKLQQSNQIINELTGEDKALEREEKRVRINGEIIKQNKEALNNEMQTL